MRRQLAPPVSVELPLHRQPRPETQTQRQHASAVLGNAVAPSSPAGVPGATGLSGNGPITLTIAQIVNIALGNNTAVIEARQRLQKAEEQIKQLNAQIQPQIRADAADTYSSYRATATTLGPTVQNPVLPSGGTIPTITDQSRGIVRLDFRNFGRTVASGSCRGGW